jgi:hypothetical protein
MWHTIERMRRGPGSHSGSMDQEFYPWSPIVARPPLQWPEGARVELAVIVNLEHWDWEVPAGTPGGREPDGRSRGAVERQPAAIPGYRRLWLVNSPASFQGGSFPVGALMAAAHAAAGADATADRRLPDAGCVH